MFRNCMAGVKGWLRACSAVGALLLVMVGTSYAASGTTERVTVDSNGNQFQGTYAPCGCDYFIYPHSSIDGISGDGRYVLFTSDADGLGYSDNNYVHDIFVHDRQAHTTRMVNLDINGYTGNEDDRVGAISADGRYVLFSSGDSAMVAGLPETSATRLFLYNTQTGVNEQVILRANVDEAAGDSYDPIALSGDARFIVFQSNVSNLVLGDTNNWWDTFIHDRVTGTTELLPHVGTAPTLTMSGNAEYVAFSTYATNVVPGDTNNTEDVFVLNRATQSLELISYSNTGQQGNGSSGGPSISADGRFVAFRSDATNLVAGDTNATTDVFIRDRQTGMTERISMDSAGNEGKGSSRNPTISSDGNFVTFLSDASNLVPDDTNGQADIFVYDRLNHTTKRASIDTSGAEANNGSVGTPYISADGRFIAFNSYASNLVIGDTNDSVDIFVRDWLGVANGPESVSMSVSGGETVSTGRDATPSDALETTITVPAGTSGELSITEQSTPSTTTAPTGFEFLGQQVTIEGPTATASNPYRL